jgi:hypothetical protein
VPTQFDGDPLTCFDYDESPVSGHLLQGGEHFDDIQNGRRALWSIYEVIQNQMLRGQVLEMGLWTTLYNQKLVWSSSRNHKQKLVWSSSHNHNRQWV